MSCPLCDYDRARPSWVGTTVYAGHEFPYVECERCGSLYCEPMPNDDIVALMYGPDYGADPEAESVATDDPREPRRVVELIRGRLPGVFVDYGCRDGSLLVEAAKLNWRTVGVELDARVARETAARTGAEVITPSDEKLTDGFADVIHLGDVIEHLTKVNEQLPAMLRLLKPGGLFLAQGPLEGNANLFTAAIRLSRKLTGPRRIETPPRHVMLATSAGQRALFARFGLTESEYRMREVAWPAPSRLSLSVLKDLRGVTLFVLRRCSQALSSLRPGVWGNRYFYAGIKLEDRSPSI
ncbi:MAG: class I SAM-dependent methyltransferase [Pyrinomonadaceae bacterium]